MRGRAHPIQRRIQGRQDKGAPTCACRPRAHKCFIYNDQRVRDVIFFSMRVDASIGVAVCEKNLTVINAAPPFWKYNSVINRGWLKIGTSRCCYVNLYVIYGAIFFVLRMWMFRINHILNLIVFINESMKLVFTNSIASGK